MKDILFKKVKCNAFLKKASDGKFIELYRDSLAADYIDHKNPDFNLKCECDGSLEFLKVYYEVKKRNFKGIVVGIKDIVTTAYLTVDTSYHYDGTEYIYPGKVPEKICKCAIVYYSNNRKSYVPLENIEVGD